MKYKPGDKIKSIYYDKWGIVLSCETRAVTVLFDESDETVCQVENTYKINKIDELLYS